MRGPIALRRTVAVAATAAVGAVATAAVAAAAVVGASPVLLAAPASAVEPTGGCWVWGEGPPPYNVSSTLAPWTDPAAAPVGPAEHTMTLSPSSPAPGDTVTITYGFNKGPKNAGPATHVVGTFSFEVNGSVVTGTKDFGTVAGAKPIPGATITATFAARAGENVVVLKNDRFRAVDFGLNIDCNGQPSGNPNGNNPRTAPLSTNVTATVVGTGTPGPSDTASPTASPTESPTDPGSSTPTATTTPTTAPTSAPTTPSEGEPAAGDVDFACVLHPLESDFDYAATMSVSGYRVEDGDPISLQATMSDIPGIAPLPIDADMKVTVGLDADGKAVTLKGSSHVSVGPKVEVPVPPLTGTLASDADEVEIAAKTFTFDFPDMDIDATCRAVGDGKLSTMTVGTEAPSSPVTDDPSDSSGGGGGGTGGGGDPASSSGGTLPHTGGTSSLPVLGLWAGALLLLGAGALAMTPRLRPYQRQH